MIHPRELMQFLGQHSVRRDLAGAGVEQIHAPRRLMVDDHDE